MIPKTNGKNILVHAEYARHVVEHPESVEALRKKVEEDKKEEVMKREDEIKFM